MRYSFLCILLLFCYSLQASGQSIEPGYLVLSSGDTVRGEVENGFWADPPTVVRFRKTAAESLTSYSAVQLRGVGLHSGRRLRLELLPLDRSATTAVGHLPDNNRSYQHPEQVLADVLVEGPALLLAVTLNNVHHFFVRREGQPYLEMTERNYLKLREGVMTIVDGNNYKNELHLYFGDCAAAAKATAQAAFTAKDLTAVVQVYNQQCSAAHQLGWESAGAKTGAGKVGIRLGAVLGARYNSVPFSGTGGAGPNFTGVNADGRVHAQVGGYFDVLAPGRRLALHTALLVSQHGSSRAGTVPVDQQTGSFRWRGTLVTGQFGLRGLLPLGATTQLVVGGGYEVTTSWNFTSELVVAGRKSEFLPSLSGAPVYLEAGLIHNRLSFTVHRQVFRSITYADYTVSAQSLNAVLGYRLNANADTPPPTRK